MYKKQDTNLTMDSQNYKPMSSILTNKLGRQLDESTEIIKQKEKEDHS
jgi:hypothetical protein